MPNLLWKEWINNIHNKNKDTEMNVAQKKYQSDYWFWEWVEKVIKVTK